MSLTIENSVKDELTRVTKEHCLVWRFRRRDKQKFYWTNHNAPIQFPQPNGPIYSPLAAVNMGDESKSAGGEPDSAEARGVMRTDAITFDDVRGGRWKLCKVQEQLVNWRMPWHAPIYTAQYFIQDMEASGEGWRAELESIAFLLKNQFGLTCAPGCKNAFAAAYGKGASVIGCRFDPSTEDVFPVPITTVVSQSEVNLDTSFLPSQSDGYYDNGWLRWLNGANEGISIKISSYVDSQRKCNLVREAPFPIATTDQVYLQYGCGKTWVDCQARGQTAYYRGFRFMPTEEDLEPAARSRE